MFKKYYLFITTCNGGFDIVYKLYMKRKSRVFFNSTFMTLSEKRFCTTVQDTSVVSGAKCLEQRLVRHALIKPPPAQPT